MALTVPDDEFPREPHFPDGAASAEGARANVAMRASRIRSRLVFTLIDAFCIFVGYGLAEIAYFRDKAPGLYWQHFAPFLGVVMVITLVANHVFGLYGRMWRHAGAEEARQLVLSAATVVSLLIVAYPLGRWGKVDWCRWRSSSSGACSPPPGWGSCASTRGCSPGNAARAGSACGWPSSAAAMPGLPPSGRCCAARGPVWCRWRCSTTTRGPTASPCSASRWSGRSTTSPTSASRYTLQQVLLAIPNPPPELVQRVLQACETAGLTMKVLPGGERPGRRLVAHGLAPPGARASDRGPPGPHAGADRPRHRPPVAGRPSGPGHRGRRLDRLGDLPPGGRARPGPARAPRPRRDPSPRHRGHGHDHVRAGTRRHQRPVGGDGRLRAVPARGGVPRRRPQARPGARASPRSRRPGPTSSAPSTWSRRPPRSAPSGSCRSPRTRRCARRASWVRPSAWPSRSCCPGRRRAPRTARSGSGTCSAAGAA